MWRTWTSQRHSHSFGQNPLHSRLTSWAKSSSSFIQSLSVLFTPGYSPWMLILGSRKGWFLSSNNGDFSQHLLACAVDRAWAGNKLWSWSSLFVLGLQDHCVFHCVVENNGWGGVFIHIPAVSLCVLFLHMPSDPSCVIYLCLWINFLNCPKIPSLPSRRWVS